MACVSLLRGSLAVLCTVLLATLPRSLAHAHTNGNALFVFGDSQVDVGNNNFLNTSIKANFYPYGITHLNSSGRFSNGFVLPDFLASFLNIPSPPPYLSQQGCSTSYGVNFASGGAGVLNTTNSGECLSLETQLGFFLSLRSSCTISEELAARAWYLVNIGANDLLNVPQNASAVPAYLDLIVEGYISFVQALYTAGARKFILLLIGPLGCTPGVRASLGGGGGPPTLHCNAAAENLTLALNAALVSAIRSDSFIFNSTFNTTLVKFDQYTAGLNILKNSKKFGFSSLDACCGGPGALNGLVPCGRSEVINGTTVSYVLCRDIQRHFFWDDIHSTESVNKYSADAIWRGSKFSDPRGGAQGLL